ncbi:hypothetical protein [Afifella aestuarii]|uniref:hypothetical protein n=1 Tax=Afifella aestuarii TaxID=1909496 RepID=UPI000FE3CC95|nr:hypothetical protein [Afifella aestuarii]
MTALLANPLAIVAAVLAVLASYGGTYAVGDHYGYARAEATWQAKYDRLVADTEKASAEETIRQQQANAEARRAADETIAELRYQLAQQDVFMKELENAADSDPNALRDCLGPDSVRRLQNPAGR